MVILLLGTIGTASADETNKKEFKRSGTVFGTAFTGINVSSSDGKTSTGFVLDRLEIGYVYHFSENWLFKGCFDVSDPKNSSLQHTAFARNAFGEYHNSKLTVRFGMITGISFNFIEKQWGYRYVAKCYQEYFDYSSSRDIGITGAYRLNNALSIDAIISNGEGYKSRQSDDYLEYGLGVTWKPKNRMEFRLYADMIDTEEITEHTSSVMLGYSFKNGCSIGGEYNMLQNQSLTEGNKQSGCSFYSTVKINDKFKLFARYDYNDRKDSWDSGDNAQVIFTGAEFSPVKGVKITPNYIHSSHSVKTMPSTNEFRLSCELKF